MEWSTNMDMTRKKKMIGSLSFQVTLPWVWILALLLNNSVFSTFPLNFTFPYLWIEANYSYLRGLLSELNIIIYVKCLAKSWAYFKRLITGGVMVSEIFLSFPLCCCPWRFRVFVEAGSHSLTGIPVF